jgi:hypoxanthine phosphoribosyltransferase
MEIKSHMDVLGECFSIMAWLQIKLARLGRHTWADMLGDLMDALEKQAKLVEDGRLSFEDSDLLELSEFLKSVSKDEETIGDVHLDKIRKCVKKICEKKDVCFQKVLLIRKDDIKSKVKEIADTLKKEINTENTIFLGVLKGSIFFFVDLLRALELDVKFDFIEAKSYGNSMDSSKDVSFTKITDMDLVHKIVVVVEDIVDTGHTMKYVLKKLYERNPLKILTCVLIDKYERREVDVQIDYFGFRIEKGFVVGYGLDFADQFRCLPDIYALEKVNGS